MAKYYLTKKAVSDLEEIWHYTVDAWSSRQAEIYYALLLDSCQELANNPLQGKTYEIVEKKVRGYKTGQHIIFYRIVTTKEIEIIRILHGNMDLKLHI